MENYDYVIKHLPIYKAAMQGDWKTASRIFAADKQAINAYITYKSETPLHIAVGANTSYHFVKELVELIMDVDPQMLRTGNNQGNNALHYAAKVGNTDVARLLIEKDPEIVQISNPRGSTALKMAAWSGRKETLCYLLQETKDLVGEKGTSPYRKQDGADLLTLTITADLYDVALYLVNNYQDLVTEKNNISSKTGLQTLAAKSNAFQSGSRLGFWQGVIYQWIPVNRQKALEPPVRLSDVMKTQSRTKATNGLKFFFWSLLQYLAPHIKQMHETKVKHIQAQELVKQMCSTVINKENHAIAWDVLGMALSTAVTHGIHEFVEECIQHYPGLIWYHVRGFYLFLAAIRDRQEKVYNLVYQMSGHKMFVATHMVNGENALHFAGKLAPPHRLNTVTGAALQMQRELQWFKEVENFVEPSYKEALNRDNKTPQMLFTSEHKELLKDAQQWMKDTSASATVVAALIFTMAFAAIFTAPGGNNDDGKPLFLNDTVFILFAISDAVSFLYAATMVAFSATLALVLRDKIQWIAAPVTLLASVPVALFLLLQYPLLVELVSSTYGRGIFYKQNNMLFY